MINRPLLLILVIIGIQFSGNSQIDSTYQTIDEVIISTDKPKTIAFEDPKYFIVDFSITETQTLLLMKNLGNYYLYELDEDMEFRHKLKLDLNVNSLFDDCFGNTHIVAKDSIYFVMNDAIGLFLTETHPKRRMSKVLAKCAGMTSDKIVMESRSHLTGDLTFYTIDLDSGYREIIYQINDSTIAKSKRDAEILRDMEANVPKSYSSRDTRERKRSTQIDLRAYLPGFLFGPEDRPEYNPMFVVEDTLYVFNHAEGRIDKLDDRGNLLHSRKIDYQHKKRWKKIIYSDKTTKKFYAAWMENGAQHLIGIGLNDDEQDFGTKITKHAYPEKVVILDGYAYYLYKPNYDANLNKLYRQEL